MKRFIKQLYEIIYINSHQKHRTGNTFCFIKNLLY